MFASLLIGLKILFKKVGKEKQFKYEKEDKQLNNYYCP
jgi:hypothetical protein